MLAPLNKEIQEIRDFIAYYEVEPPLVKRYARRVLLDELELLGSHYNLEKLKIDIENLVYDNKDPENDTEQLTINLAGILKSLNNAREDVSLAWLHKIQVALHQQMLHQSAGAGLRMETNSLFGGGAEHEDTLEKDAREWLDETLKMSHAKDIPAPLRAWLFYYYFNVLKPFESNNELLSYISSKKILSSSNYDFFNALNLEKYVFMDKEVVAAFGRLMLVEDFHQRLHADLTEYIHACMEGFLNAIKQIKEAVMQVVREQMDYTSLTPRQKNSLNFWLEKGFFMHKDKLDELTPRQHEIMLLIAKYGSLSNKDLVPVFMVDRKTIQRDFNTLFDLKLLDQRGGGRALKYYLNLRVEL